MAKKQKQIDTLERVAVERKRRVLLFERRLNYPVKEVWAALTKPERLALWLARTDAELTKVGGQLKLQFDNTGAVVYGKITQVKPPTLLEYTWDTQEEPEELPAAALLAGDGTCIQDLRTSRVRFELSDLGGSTLLTLSHTLGEAQVRQDIVLASWHLHLDGLVRSLGQPQWPWGDFEALRNKYSQQLG